MSGKRKPKTNDLHEKSMSSPRSKHSKAPSPPLASIAKKVNPSAVEEVVVGRMAGADRTLEAALEPEISSRSGLKIR